MRWAARISVLFLFVIAGYTIWPFWDLYRLGRAIERRDIATLVERVELRALHGSINRQVASAYLKMSGREASLGRAGSDLAIGLAAQIVQPVVEQRASAERLLDVLAGGWPRDAFAGTIGSRIALMPRNLGTLWRLYANSEYSLQDFYVSVPVAVAPSQRFRLRLRLIKWTWKLYEVQLPEELRLRLANELVKATGK